MLFDHYDPPLDDRLLYYLAGLVNVNGTSDPEDLVQEARIKMWQLWQETQWVRTCPARSPAYYTTAVKRRMRVVCYRQSPPFGGTARSGYSDALNHAIEINETTKQIPVETPFELLDRIPAVLVGLVG